MSKARDIASATPAPSTVSSTELGYLDGVSSAIQTQLNAKEATLPSQTGNSGKYLTTDGTNTSWGFIDANNIDSGTLNAARPPAFSGDASSTAGTSSLTLATVNSNTGSFGGSSSIPVITVNGKGLVTAVSTATVAGGQYFGNAAVKAIAYNASTINENITMTYNGMSVGAITIGSGYSVTVNAGVRWVIL